MTPADFSGFTREDTALLKRLNSPGKVQEFVDSLEYTFKGRICPANVIKQKKGDCLEAAIFSTAVFHFHKIDSFLMDLRAVRDEDHILSVYRINGKYGSVAKSKFCWLRFRNPVYASVRELVMSYFEHYFNYFGELSLREYSVPYRLARWKNSWLYDDKTIRKIEKEMDAITHYRIALDDKSLSRVDPVSFTREVMIIPKGARVGKKYLQQA